MKMGNVWIVSDDILSDESISSLFSGKLKKKIHGLGSNSN